MRKMDPQSIRDTFNEKKKSVRDEWAKYGLLDALQQLSMAVSNLKAAGLDVSLEISAWPSEQSFSLFNRQGALVVPVEGELRMGNSSRTLGIATKLDGNPVLMLALSKFDSRHQGTHGTLKDGEIKNNLRSLTYDLKNNPDALVEFQKEIIAYCARMSTLAEQDTEKAFNTGMNDSLPKPALKLSPKAP